MKLVDNKNGEFIRQKVASNTTFSLLDVFRLIYISSL
jgi:hypothetical protein